MSTTEYYTLGDAARLLGENRNLVSYLVQDRCIPSSPVGNAVVLDANGLELLRGAISDFNSKPDLTRRRRHRRAAAATS